LESRNVAEIRDCRVVSIIAFAIVISNLAG